MLANISFFKRRAKRYHLLWITAGILTLTGSAHADSGSSQAIMTFIVPEQPVNLTAAPPAPSVTSQPYYNHEATAQILQQVDGMIHQVWITL